MLGAAKRLRPKFMTFAALCIGLFPILWGTGAGADVMKRIAAPMVGGIFTSFLLELLVYPRCIRYGDGTAAEATAVARGTLAPRAVASAQELLQRAD